ncbi:SDR family NAD(P)-dependent oxidoreductase [Sphingobacterium sp. 18053]|uniref:SDR family NAD(P)-dependent oxidoreductase n=1 Tax=Sphingobacterium sp. 18053 TaxID=2681401 RepID=UPI00135BFB59|nr:SDR family oxidoreductase [Sphingobacterium sp. 18053]
MSKKLANKIAVITGGSSGIGLATAKKFVEEGAYVFITGRRQTELDKAVKEIGSNVTAVQGDVSNLDDLDNLFNIIKKEKGTLDIVVTSAGFVETAATLQVTPEHFEKTFNINAKGTFFTVQKAIPLLNDGGNIVVVSSNVQWKGFPQYATYAASKAALRSFVRTWASELKDKQIRVNSISPGPIETPLMNGQFKSKEEAEQTKKYFAELIPLGRIGNPEEIATSILFLASSDSGYINAVDLVADGGYTQI